MWALDGVGNRKIEVVTLLSDQTITSNKTYAYNARDQLEVQPDTAFDGADRACRVPSVAVLSAMDHRRAVDLRRIRCLIPERFEVVAWRKLRTFERSAAALNQMLKKNAPDEAGAWRGCFSSWSEWSGHSAGLSVSVG